jgi:hypothetical protein
MHYFDVYLIHCSMSAKPGLAFPPVKRDDIVPPEGCVGGNGVPQASSDKVEQFYSKEA